MVRDGYQELHVLDRNLSSRVLAHRDGTGSDSDLDGIGLRSRRVGPRHRRRDLDCYYHGVVSGREEGSSAVVSACELPLKIHATVRIDGGAWIEVQPVDSDNGGHVGYTNDDLDEPKRSCGVVDDSINSVHGVGGSHTDVLGAPENRSGPAAGGRRRQACTKTVEVLIINDNALFGRLRGETEANSADVLALVADIYSDGSPFSCRIQIRLVGQITFRHGNPGDIVTRRCDQPWYYDNLPTAADSACCAATTYQAIRNNCPAGDSFCFARHPACANTHVGCQTYHRSWHTSGTTRRYMYTLQGYSDGSCATRSTSEFETDENVMLTTSGDWAVANAAELRAIFGGTIDAVMLFSGLDFTGNTVGLAVRVPALPPPRCRPLGHDLRQIGSGAWKGVQGAIPHFGVVVCCCCLLVVWVVVVCGDWW